MRINAARSPSNNSRSDANDSTTRWTPSEDSEVRTLLGQQMDSTRITSIADDIATFAATLRDGLDKLGFAERQRLVRLLLERVVVIGDKVTIEHAIPLSLG